MTTMTLSDAAYKVAEKCANDNDAWKAWRVLADVIEDHLAKGAQVPDVKEVPDYNDYYGVTEDGIPKDYGHGYAEGWNACRQAMLSKRGEVES